VLDHLEGVGPELSYAGPARPFIAVPTTADTGSEASYSGRQLHRQLEIELSALVGLAPDEQAAAVQLNDTIGNRQPKACTCADTATCSC
jgi:hypothetical protein